MVDTTSGRPAVSRRVAEALSGNGVGYLDAGVSGGVGGAAAGTLKIMIGGDARLVARCRPLLEALGTSRWHCGPVGSGHAMKTVLNLSAQTKMMAEIESLLIARAAGLDAQQTAEVLGLGVWQHYLLGIDGRTPFGFTLGLVTKDHDVAMGLASDLHVAAPVSATAQQAMRAVMNELGPDADLVDFVGVFEKWSNVSIDGPAPTGGEGGG